MYQHYYLRTLYGKLSLSHILVWLMTISTTCLPFFELIAIAMVHDHYIVEMVGQANSDNIVLR